MAFSPNPAPKLGSGELRTRAGRGSVRHVRYEVSREFT